MSLGTASLAQAESPGRQPLHLEITGTVRVIAIDAVLGEEGGEMRTGIVTPEGKWVSVTDAALIDQLEPGMEVTVTGTVPQAVVDTLPQVSPDKVKPYLDEDNELPASSDLGVQVLERVSLGDSPLTLANLVIESTPKTLDIVSATSLAHVADIVVVTPPNGNVNWITDATINAYMAQVQARMRTTLDNRFTMQAASIKRMYSSVICTNSDQDHENQWQAAAAQFGHSATYYTAPSRRHLIVLENEAQCAPNQNVAGYGNVGYGVSANFGGLLTFRVPGNATPPADTVVGIIHEMGHNLGLYHSERIQCQQVSGTVTWNQANSTNCQAAAYGDNWETMGSPGDGGWGAIRKYQLGILRDGEGIRRIKTAGASTGSATLSPVANNTVAQQGIVFTVDDGYGSLYGVEYRRSGNTNLGLAILDFNARETWLFQPANNAKYNYNFWDPSVYLTVGQTFISADGKLSITLTAMSAASATVSWSVVSVGDACGDTQSSSCVIAKGDWRTSSRIDFADDWDWFEFTAPITSDYVIFSASTEDMYGVLLDANAVYITENDDGYAAVEPYSNQFMMIQPMTKGEVLYVAAAAYDPEAYGINYSVSVCPLFNDVSPAHTFYGPICWAALTGVTVGTGAGNYSPSDPVNRGSMAAFLYRMAGSPTWTSPATSPFTDVPKTHKFYKEITWLAATGITVGVTIGGLPYYQPNNVVNRGSMSAFMYRLSGSPTYTAPATPTFADVGTAHTFYRTIAWLASKNITAGTTVNGQFVYQPSNPVNRGSMAAFLSRLASQHLQCTTYPNGIGCAT
jgi:hypothetical protein